MPAKLKLPMYARRAVAWKSSPLESKKVWAHKGNQSALECWKREKGEASHLVARTFAISYLGTTSCNRFSQNSGLSSSSLSGTSAAFFFPFVFSVAVPAPPRSDPPPPTELEAESRLDETDPASRTLLLELVLDGRGKRELESFRRGELGFEGEGVVVLDEEAKRLFESRRMESGRERRWGEEREGVGEPKGMSPGKGGEVAERGRRKEALLFVVEEGP
jgi:hypothetical protein